MKASRFALLSTAACGTVAAFVAPSRPKDTALLLAIDASIVDPSIVSDPTVLIGAAGAAVAAAVAGFSKGASGDATKKAAPKRGEVDVSVPYDAAATLAYNAYAESSTKKVAFNTFKALYEAQMVAEVKSKVQVEKVNEKKVEVEALKAELAAMEGELAGMEGDVAGLDDEAASCKSQIEELFGAPN